MSLAVDIAWFLIKSVRFGEHDLHDTHIVRVNKSLDPVEGPHFYPASQSFL